MQGLPSRGGAAWCSISAISLPVTTSRITTIRGPTRFTRCRCGSARTAAWRSCSTTRPCQRSPGAPSPPRSSRRRRTPWRVAAAAGLLPPGARVAEYGSPHGGSWLGLLADRGLRPVDGTEEADVILDCFGMMHAADQAGAMAERAARLAPGGVLLLQYHSLDTIIRLGQWNALRHGHYAYYSTTALSAMLAAVGCSPRAAWHFDLYGGTVLLAARRDAATRTPDETVQARCSRLRHAPACVTRTSLAGFSATCRPGPPRCTAGSPQSAAAGRTVLGYGAASRAVALLRKAGGRQRPAARGGRRVTGQARAADAGDGDSRDQPGGTRRATPGRGGAVRLGPDGRGPRHLPGDRGQRRPLGGRRCARIEPG